MPTFSSDVAAFFHDSHGIAATFELDLLDVGDEQRRHLLEHGILLPLFEGVYRLASSPLTFHGRCRAVCVADPSLILCCFTAGSLANLRRCGSSWLHAVTNRGTKPVGPTVRVHRSGLDLSEHTVHRPDGIRHTSAAQTFFDLSKHVDDVTLRSIGEQIIADGLATYDELVARTKEIAKGGRPGSGRALRVLGSRSNVGTAADSHGEVVLLEALHAAGLTQFVRHPPIRLRDGSVVHPDMGVPAIGLYVEVDHHTWHTSIADVEYDKGRDREIRLTGAEVERVTTSQIETALAPLVADLGMRYRQRLALIRR